MCRKLCLLALRLPPYELLTCIFSLMATCPYNCYGQIAIKKIRFSHGEHKRYATPDCHYKTNESRVFCVVMATHNCLKPRRLMMSDLTPEQEQQLYLARVRFLCHENRMDFF